MILDFFVLNYFLNLLDKEFINFQVCQTDTVDSKLIPNIEHWCHVTGTTFKEVARSGKLPNPNRNYSNRSIK